VRLALPDALIRRVTDRLDDILTSLRALGAQGKQALMASAEIKAALAKIDTATDNIAADIKRLKALIVPGMTTAEVAEVQAEADRIAAKLEGIAADPDNPDPA
jgi:hypothetical protein